MLKVRGEASASHQNWNVSGWPVGDGDELPELQLWIASSAGLSQLVTNVPSDIGPLVGISCVAWAACTAGLSASALSAAANSLFNVMGSPALCDVVDSASDTDARVLDLDGHGRQRLGRDEDLVARDEVLDADDDVRNGRAIRPAIERH